MRQYIAILLVLLVFMCGCIKRSDQKIEVEKFTAITSTGNVYSNLTWIRSSASWTTFETENGKELILHGDYTYMEQ